MVKRSSYRSGARGRNIYKASVLEVDEKTKAARTCLLCGKTDPQTFAELENHVRTFHQVKTRIYPCPHCDDPFYSPKDRNRHMVACKGKPLPPVPFPGSAPNPE